MRIYHYDVHVGDRFLQTDPIGYRDDLDLYGYVGNDPINKSDPSGLAQCDSSLKKDSAKCEKALNDSDAARNNANTAANGLNDLAGRMKDGKLTAQDSKDLQTISDKFGKKFTSAEGLTKLSSGLKSAADKIWGRGAGAKLVDGGSSSKLDALAFPVAGSIHLYNGYFNQTNPSNREY